MLELPSSEFLLHDREHKLFLVSIIWGNFPGGPVIKTLPSNVRGMGLNPGWRAKIPHALWPKNQNIKHK